MKAVKIFNQVPLNKLNEYATSCLLGLLLPKSKIEKFLGIHLGNLTIKIFSVIYQN